jgi:hypothetical protein
MATATNEFATHASFDAPFTRASVITPHDTNEIAYVTRGVYVGGAGTLTVVMQDGSTCLFSGIPAGTVLPIRVKIIKSTGTTATLIVAMS